MKTLLLERSFKFDSDNFNDVWIIGKPIPLFNILINIRFKAPLKERFDLILTLMIPNSATIPYNFSKNKTGGNILIGKKIDKLTDECGIIQVEGNTGDRVEGIVYIYEIDESDRVSY